MTTTTKPWEHLTPEQRDKLAQNAPYRIGLRLKDGKAEGLVEHSFSLGESPTETRLWWSGKAHSNFGTVHEISGEEDAAYNCHENDGWIILDPCDDDCPVTVDWVGFLTATNKYHKRNPRFYFKEEGGLTSFILVATRKELADSQDRIKSLEEYNERLRGEVTSLEGKLEAIKNIIHPDGKTE